MPTAAIERPWFVCPGPAVQLDNGTWIQAILADGPDDDICPAKALGRTQEEAEANAKLIARSVNRKD